MWLTCWSDQGVVQSGHGGWLLLGQSHPDLLLDSPGFRHGVRTGTVRGNHVGGTGGVGLQGGQKAALRHRHTHADSGTHEVFEPERRRGACDGRWRCLLLTGSAVKWQQQPDGLGAGPAGPGGAGQRESTCCHDASPQRKFICGQHCVTAQVYFFVLLNCVIFEWWPWSAKHNKTSQQQEKHNDKQKTQLHYSWGVHVWLLTSILTVTNDTLTFTITQLFNSFKL